MLLLIGGGIAIFFLDRPATTLAQPQLPAASPDSSQLSAATPDALPVPTAPPDSSRITEISHAPGTSQGPATDVQPQNQPAPVPSQTTEAPSAPVVAQNPADGAKPSATPADRADASLSPPEQGNASRILSFGKATEKANAGDAYAQAILSIYYGIGYKTQKHVEKSAALAIASAKQGHPLGIYRLGVMRQAGEGMQKSDEQGKKLKSQSIDGLNRMEGDPYALTALGVMLFRGDVVGEDKSEAARVYQLAADQGYAPAQYSYAICLHSGTGVPKDPDLARLYLERAAAQFYPPALEGMPK